MTIQSDMESNVPETFHVILFYEEDSVLLQKNLQIISRQYLKDYVIHIIADNAIKDNFNREFEDFVEKENGIIHFVNGIAGENLSLLADVIRTISNGWICFLKPADEWMPYHLTAMKDATVQFPESRFFYTQNANGSLKCIKAPYLNANLIDYRNVDLKEQISLSQMMIHHSIADNVFLPGLWLESHSDTMVKLSFMKTFSLQRINRFTCACKNLKYAYNRNYFDPLILTTSFVVRNLIAENHSLRVKLMSKVYRSSVWISLRRMRFVYSFILLSEMFCCMSGLRKGIKGGVANVD